MNCDKSWDGIRVLLGAGPFTLGLRRPLLFIICPVFLSDAPYESPSFVSSRGSIAWKARKSSIIDDTSALSMQQHSSPYIGTNATSTCWDLHYGRWKRPQSASVVMCRPMYPSPSKATEVYRYLTCQSRHDTWLRQL